MDTPLSSSEQSYSQTLSTIPRASKPTLSSSSVTMGNSVTIYTNRASSISHTRYIIKLAQTVKLVLVQELGRVKVGRFRLVLQAARRILQV